MSIAVNQFLEAAKVVHDDDLRITSGGQDTIMKECPGCGLMAPHILTEDGTKCAICGYEIKRESAG